MVDDYSAFAYTFDQNGNYDIYDFRSPDDSYLTNQFKAGLNGQFSTGSWQHKLSLNYHKLTNDMHAIRCD